MDYIYFFLFINLLFAVTCTTKFSSLLAGLSFYTSEKTLREAFQGFGELVDGTFALFTLLNENIQHVAFDSNRKSASGTFNCSVNVSLSFFSKNHNGQDFQEV